MRDMVVENEVFGNTLTMCSELTMVRKNLVVLNLRTCDSEMQFSKSTNCLPSLAVNNYETLWKGKFIH